MSEQEKAGRYPFIVEPFTEDVSGHLSFHTLGMQLLTCAGYHADSHGFGLLKMQEEHRGWVLSRLVIECTDMPRTQESYEIETFVNKVYRQFTDRMFVVRRGGGADNELQATEGSICGYGFSTWALIDYESRTPVSLDGEYFAPIRTTATDRTIPIAGPGRIRVKSQEAVSQHVVAFSDLDINGHMNSIRSIDLLLDQAITQIGQSVRRIDVSYGREAMLGDTLYIFREGDQYEIRLEDNTVLVRAEIKLA